MPRRSEKLHLLPVLVLQGEGGSFVAGLEHLTAQAIFFANEPLALAPRHPRPRPARDPGARRRPGRRRFSGENGPIAYPFGFFNEGGDEGGILLHGPRQKQKPHSLTRDPSDQAPAFSPNGRLVAFEGNREGPEAKGTHIYVVRADGSGLRPLTSGLTRDSDPAFSADGKSLVFSREAVGGPRRIHLFEVPLAGGEPRQLTSGANLDTEPVVTPDGRRIVFVSTAKTDARADIYSMPAAGGSRKLLAGGERNQNGPDVSRTAGSSSSPAASRAGCSCGWPVPTAAAPTRSPTAAKAAPAAAASSIPPSRPTAPTSSSRSSAAPPATSSSPASTARR